MLEKIKKTFQNRTSRNGSYSVGLIALVVGIVVAVNLIAAQLPENIRKIDISDNKIYEISKTSKKILEESFRFCRVLSLLPSLTKTIS